MTFLLKKTEQDFIISNVKIMQLKRLSFDIISHKTMHYLKLVLKISFLCYSLFNFRVRYHIFC